MQVKCANAVRMSLIALGCALGFTGVAFGKATPARTITFDAGNCTAKFVRSASGIVNETSRECVGDQNPWIDADVKLQFRPLDGKPNPTCDPVGLVTTFVFSNTDPVLADYLPIGEQYNVCVYLENPVVSSGTLDSADIAGATSEAAPLPGTYQVCVTGTWANRNGMDVFDAEYATQDNWTTVSNGLPASDPFSSLGPNIGDVTVNGGFVDWGTYSTAHRYCTNVSLAEGETVTLAVFDGDPATGTANPDWYADNVGTLQYTVTYAGP
jgi:hypothetical protein